MHSLCPNFVTGDRVQYIFHSLPYEVWRTEIYFQVTVKKCGIHVSCTKCMMQTEYLRV